MVSPPKISILVDGDVTRTFRQGETVTGKVIVSAEKELDIRSLSVGFSGECATNGTHSTLSGVRPRQGSDDAITLFNHDKTLLSQCTLPAKKICITFDFRFPDSTDSKYPGWHTPSTYQVGPHPLPPSFRSLTNKSAVQVAVSYFLTARLVRCGTKKTVQCLQPLTYCPNSKAVTRSRLSRVVLADQSFRTQSSRKAVHNTITRRPTSDCNFSYVVPTVYYPKKASPRQRIPLSISLAFQNGQDGATGPACSIESVAVVLTTHTAFARGQNEDVATRHTTCVAKTHMNKPIAYDTPTSLTGEFRLPEDTECIPSFSTYNISRAYEVSLAVGVQCQGRKFTIRSNTPLEILPPSGLNPWASTTCTDEESEYDQLPAYEARDPTRDLAPQYDAVYQLSRPSSSVGSYAGSDSGRSSLDATSRLSTPATELSSLDF